MSNSKCVYYKEKEQKSFDGGITWVDTGNFRKGALVSTQASQCGSYTNEYRWIKADYVCDNGNKYNGYKQQVSYDNGVNWSDTGVVNIGDLIEENSNDCGYNEQWFVLTGDNNFICDGAAKYKKKEMKYTRDSGTTWNSFDPPKYEKGDVIEIESTDCAFPSMKVTYKDGTTKTFYNLTSIGEKTDSNKKNAKEVEIYDAVTVIGDSAFEECSSLTSITLPDSLTSINQWAFGNCSGLTSIVIPDSVTNIGSHAFVGCKRLTGITLSDSITSIEDAVFAVCKSLESIVIPTGVTSIGDSAFEDCPSLKSINIPTGVTSIGRYAFEKCSSLKSINIPTGVTSIGNSTFLNCSNLQSIEIPTGVISIDGRAFEGCSSLTGITISNSITSIGESAFYNCSSLTTMTVKATTPPTLGKDAISTATTTIYVPASSVNAYKSADGWSNYASKIQAIP